MLKLDSCGITGFCWRIWPSLLWNFSDGVFHLHYGPQSPSMPFIPLGVVDVFKKFEIAIFWKKYYNIKIFQIFFASQNMLIWLQNKRFSLKNWFWRKKKLINFCHNFSTILKFWALVTNFYEIICYKTKWWNVLIIKQPCFVM